MTRPIFEPNTNREVAAAQFASQQLFRRPAPVSAGCCPVVFRAEQWNNDVTTPAGGDLEQIVFDEYTNPDTGIFTVTTGTSSGQTGLLSVAVNVTPCLIVAKLAWDWETTWTTSSTQSQTAGIYDQITVWPMEGVEYPRLGPGSGSGELDYNMSFVEYYPTIAYEQGHGGVAAPTFTFWLSQNTASNRAAQARMTIAYFPLG